MVAIKVVLTDGGNGILEDVEFDKELLCNVFQSLINSAT